MKVFVTGGTGFIGSHIVRQLLDAGHEVTIFARNPNKVSGFLYNSKIHFVEGTMDNREAIKVGVQGQDACIHIALAWGNTAEEMLLKETALSVYLFQTAAEAGVKKIIYTSSIACFGSSPCNDLGCTNPNDYYGATKAATECYLHAIAAQYGIQANTVRPGYTFGNPAVEGATIYTDLKIKNMVKAAKANEMMTFINNDGTQFIYVEDLAKIYIELLHSNTINRRYFTGVSADFRTWGQVAEQVVEYLGSKSEVLYEDKGWDVPNGLPIDVSQIKEAFNFEFRTDDYMLEHIKYLCALKA